MDSQLRTRAHAHAIGDLEASAHLFRQLKRTARSPAEYFSFDELCKMINNGYLEYDQFSARDIIDLLQKEGVSPAPPELGGSHRRRSSYDRRMQEAIRYFYLAPTREALLYIAILFDQVGMNPNVDFCGLVRKTGTNTAIERDRPPTPRKMVTQRNPDASIRKLERQQHISEGDASISMQLLRARLRNGEISNQQLQVAALLGDQAAAVLTGLTPVPWISDLRLQGEPSWRYVSLEMVNREPALRALWNLLGKQQMTLIAMGWLKKIIPQLDRPRTKLAETILAQTDLWTSDSKRYDRYLLFALDEQLQGSDSDPDVMQAISAALGCALGPENSEQVDSFSLALALTAKILAKGRAAHSEVEILEQMRKELLNIALN